MKRFDYSFLKNKVPSDLIELVSGIYSLRTSDYLRKTKYVSIYTELEKIAKVQSVKGSNAIEGIVTTDERIDAIVNQNSAPLNHNETEIAGYRDALNLVHTQYNNLQFNEQTFLDLHKLLLAVSRPTVAGQYKTSDNVIMEVKADGTKSIRFAPIPASETKTAIEQLILAYIDARDQLGVNQILLIPCVILDFLCIHPFSDGNGRMSRLLSLLLLYKAGFDAGKYVSFEGQINKRKSYYYESLRKSSIGWHENKNDYFYFVTDFLITLLSCYKELDSRFSTINSKKINKTSRIEATVLNSITPISKRKICEILPDISLTTVEYVLSKMVKDGKIIKIGNSSNTAYFRKD